MPLTAEEKRKRRAAQATAQSAADAAQGISRQPAHRPPAGMRWDKHAASWVPAAEKAASDKAAVEKAAADKVEGRSQLYRSPLTAHVSRLTAHELSSRLAARGSPLRYPYGSRLTAVTALHHDSDSHGLHRTPLTAL